MYWISKQHKNPYKFRFIAGSSHCTTKPLSVLLSLVLKLIKSHFKSYCQKIFKNSGLQMYWSIDNSLECIQKLSNVEASCIHTYDFSTLYTNLPLKDIHEKLTELVSRMYKNAYAKYISVNVFTQKAFWSNEWKKGYTNFTLHHVLDALEFVLNNTYVKFGDYIFLQTKGIPMGGNASPLIADLYLSWLEFSFLSKLEKKDTGLIYSLRHNCRYIDDIATPNFDNFLSIASQIYPKEIPLEPNDGNGLHDTFLDLDISICDSDFIFKVFHKVDLFNFEVISFPFLESNIPQRICYSTFFSQLIRFLRICSNIHGFAERVQLLWNKLMVRNYEATVLKRYFKKFICQYSDEIVKYGYSLSDILQYCLEYDASHNHSLPIQACLGLTNVTSESLFNQPVQSSNSEFWASSLIRGPIPLHNLCNTCYLNSILQILFQINSIFSFETWIRHLVQIDKTLYSEDKHMLLFYKFLYLCKLHTISHEEMCDFNRILTEINSFFNHNLQRDVHAAFELLLEAFNSVCSIPTADQEFSDTPEFMDYYLGGIFHKRFTCNSCQGVNNFVEAFRSFIIQPSVDLYVWLANSHTEQIVKTCEYCHMQETQDITSNIYEFPRILMIQLSRFSVSNLHHRYRKNSFPNPLYEKVRFGLVEYELFGVIEHHGVSVDSSHYTCLILHKDIWYMCNDHVITKVSLPSLSKNSYLLFYYKKDTHY